MQPPEQKRSDRIRRIVREGYAQIARSGFSCCNPIGSCCDSARRPIGYSPEELEAVPKGADLGLGCGNPVALASLKLGETVLDLGCGAGVDCFIAARKVGPTGRVIGVDMTPEMLEQACANARKLDLTNVEFRLGEIEHLPVADCSVDVVISNCVINLSPDKPQVFHEAFRVLKPSGRLLVSDIVLTSDLPPPVRESVAAYVGCIAGAALKTDYLNAIAAAGFKHTEVLRYERFPVDLAANDSPMLQELVRNTAGSAPELSRTVESVWSITLSARKPR